MRTNRNILSRRWTVGVLLVSLASLAAGVSATAQPEGNVPEPPRKSAQPSKNVAPTLATALKRADRVLTVQIIGLIDKKPIALTRKHREAHWARVLRTHKGSEIAGRTIRIRPNGARWTDGLGYVVFIRRGVDDFYEALPTPDAFTLPEVEKRTGGPTARLRLIVDRTGSCGCHAHGPCRHDWRFTLAANGTFTFVEETGHGATAITNRRTGKVAKEAADRFVKQLASIPLTVAPDGGTVLRAEFAPAVGRSVFRKHALEVDASGWTVKRLIETFARTHGDATKRR